MKTLPARAATERHEVSLEIAVGLLLVDTLSLRPCNATSRPSSTKRFLTRSILRQTDLQDGCDILISQAAVLELALVTV